MKKIINFVIGIAFCAVLSSCVTTAYGQIETEEADANVIVTYGTPYYNNGILTYYMYRNMYYYPYYHRDRLHFRHYYKPLPPRHHMPPKRDFRNNYPHHYHQSIGGYNKPYNWHFGHPNTNHRPQNHVHYGGRR